MNMRLWGNQRSWTAKNGQNAGMKTRGFVINRLVTGVITPKTVINGSNQPGRSFLVTIYRYYS